jgi:hypothetical protein
VQYCAAVSDCGAGVGRVSKELLLHLFQEVDLLEPSAHLLQTAGVCYACSDWVGQTCTFNVTARQELAPWFSTFPCISPFLPPSFPSQYAEKDLKSGRKATHPAGHRAVNFYQAGLQQHVFEPQR